ncbi:MAG: GNAT family N-acetyltransferase [Rickettsiales bacterium]
MPISVEKLTAFRGSDLSDLCQATEDAITDGIGFNWLTPPMRDVLEAYWKGVLVVPSRTLFGGRLDSTLAASIQLVRPTKSKETSAFSCEIEAHFVAPWARGHGLAKSLLEHAEREAAKDGFSIIRLSVRETQERALQIYRESGYTEWGSLPYYEFVNANMVAGHYFYKKLEPISGLV